MNVSPTKKLTQQLNRDCSWKASNKTIRCRMIKKTVGFFFLVGDIENIDQRIRYWKTTRFFHFTAASCFWGSFFYCCLQQHNDSDVTMTGVGGDRFVPVVGDIDCAQGSEEEKERVSVLFL